MKTRYDSVPPHKTKSAPARRTRSNILDGTTPQPKQQETARRLPRHATDNRVILTVAKGGGTYTLRGRASNISEAGFGAVLAGELPLDEVVQVRVVLNAKE